MNETMERLDYKEFKNLYRTMMVNDFPKNELRPIFMFRHLFKKNRFTCMVMKQESTIVAYACLIHEKNYSLLDYYAVNQSLRGKGVGSQFLSELKKAIPGDGLVIESENISKAENDEERNIRSKRVSFYERNGAVMSQYEWYAFGVDYHLLWLPFGDQVDPNQGVKEIETLYRIAMPRIAVQRFTHLTYKK